MKATESGMNGQISMSTTILRTYTGTGVSHSQHRKKKLGQVLEKMQVNGPEG